MRKTIPSLYFRRAILCLLALFGTPSTLAETITIGKGSGIMWEGLPFNVTLSGPLDDAYTNAALGLLAISTRFGSCLKPDELTTINGYKTIEIAPGVGLIPRVVGTATYRRDNSNKISTLTGTIGLPETKGVNDGVALNLSASYQWCLSPVSSNTYNYYNKDAMRTAQISGTWVLITDGSQKASEFKTPIMYAGSFAQPKSGDRSASILPSDITLRISTLECTVNTPASIAFGDVAKTTQAGAELGILSYPLITTCGQSSDFINANINLQFRQLSGLYNNAPTHLALNQGGGYITGEIDNGVTGSGSCTATTGLPFDNTQLKIGSITKAQTSTTVTNQVTWRLCSGGQDLPLGDVSAAAEMMVTFN